VILFFICLKIRLQILFVSASDIERDVDNGRIMTLPVIPTTFAAARENIETTPSLVIDLPTATRNNQKLVDYTAQHNMTVRPHTKTHKSIALARLQIAQGCSGLTVAKVGEAEQMAQASSDLLIAYPTIDPVRTRRLAELARDVTIRVAVDSIDCVLALAAAAKTAGTTIGILVDQDVGLHRTGVATSEATLDIARAVVKLQPALRLDGLFFYPGQIWAPAAEQEPLLTAVDEQLKTTLALWKSHGFSAPIVSGGSTPTAYQSHFVTSQTEIRPGTHLFNDMNTVQGGFCSLEDVAAAFICTVVSTAIPGKAVLDAGSKTFTSDRNVKYPDSGHGRVLEYPEAKIVRLSEEHGEFDYSACNSHPRVGERVTVIPNHICPCVNLQSQFWIQNESGNLEPSLVDARGLLV